MKLSSFHVHTGFCDGSNTAEEMVLAAIDAHMTELGFSAHAAWPFATVWHLAPKEYSAYLDEIITLKKKYEDRIDIFYGFEADYIPGITAPDPAFYKPFSPEFMVGSVHYVASDKPGLSANLWSVDGPVEEVAKGLASCFDGDGKRAVQAYWKTVRDMVTGCKFDIIAHLDVVRKRNGNLHFFDETESWYREELEKTAKIIARSGKVVELNTGGIARKAIDGIYPSDELLSILHREHVPVTLNSDAHNALQLTFAYDQAKDAARRAGYTSLVFFTREGWKTEGI